MSCWQARIRNAAAWTAAAWLLMAPAAMAQQAPTLREKPIVLDNCAVRALLDVRVPSRVAGVLDKVHVQEGDVVKQGQILAVVYDRLAQIEVEKKTAQANNDAPIKEAEAQLKEAEAKYADNYKLRQTNVLSIEKLRESEAVVEISQARVAQANEDRKFAFIDVKTAQEQLELHKIKSPFDGIVVQQVVQEGESIQALDPIFQVIRTDVVKVEGVLQVRYGDRVRTGMRIEIFPAMTAGERLRFHGHSSDVRAVKFLPDGVRCASAAGEGSRGRILVWDVSRANQANGLNVDEGPVTCLATSPARPDLVVCGCSEGTLKRWDLASGQVSGFQTGRGPILAAVLHPRDPNICITGHEGRDVHVWNLDQKKEIQTLSGHNNYVTSVFLSPAGDRLLSASNDQTARIWDLKRGVAELVLGGRSLEVQQLGMSADGKHILLNRFSSIEVVDSKDGKLVEEFQNETGHFSDVAVFSPVGGLILTATDNRQLHLWQMGSEDNTGEHYQRLVRTYEGHVDPIRAVDFAPHGNYFATGSSDRTVRVWRVPTLDEIAQERKGGTIGFVNVQAEAGSQTLSLTCEVENKDELLRPNTFATIVIYPQVRGPVAARE